MSTENETCLRLFRAEFMNKNRNYIGENLGRILTPRQLKRNGDMILTMLQRLLGSKDVTAEIFVRFQKHLTTCSNLKQLEL